MVFQPRLLALWKQTGSLLLDPRVVVIGVNVGVDLELSLDYLAC